MIRASERVLTVILWAMVIVFAARTVHDFSHYIDRAIYLAVDDGEANVSYAIGAEGRYGFLTSPILFDMPRHRGQFNYGPWYFYATGAMIWLFGYSLTLVRSLHLLVMLGVAFAALRWFRGDDGVVPGGIVAFAVLYCFTAAQWPMARPDSMVTACAVASIVCAGIGMRTARARWWCGAGLCAAGASFSHLIAWSVLPATGVVFLVWAWLTREEHPLSVFVRSAVALAAGALVGVIGFYASFGFAFGTQLAFVRGYRDLTASPVGFATTLQQHFGVAFNYLGLAWKPWIAAALTASWIVLAIACRHRGDMRRLASSYLLPPLAIVSAYLLSVGRYTNFHSGYAILTQVMGWWALAAAAWIGLRLLRERFPMRGGLIAFAASIAVLLDGGYLIAREARQTADKLLRAADWVPISSYVDEVLAVVPPRATAWGSVIFGNESPDRVQLVQMADAVNLAKRMSPSNRRALAPAFLLWGYPERYNGTSSLLDRKPDLLHETAELLPDEPYDVVSLVYGAPYGVTRVYARATSVAQHGDPPLVAAFDARRHEWLRRELSPLATTFAPSDPLTFRIGADGAQTERTSSRTVRADLPEGMYLIRVAVSGSGTLAATSNGHAEQIVSELGPDGDFVRYAGGDRVAYLLRAHTGGLLAISQFSDDQDAPMAIDVIPVVPAVRNEEQLADYRFEPVRPGSWETPTQTTVVARVDSGGLDVAGDTTQFGYQVMGPRMRGTPGGRVGARVAMTQTSGHVCVGALNGTEQRWLVPPTFARPEYWFDVDRTGAFRIVVSNCNAAATGNAQSRFRVDSASIAVANPDFYVDRLMNAAGFGVPR